MFVDICSTMLFNARFAVFNGHVNDADQRVRQYLEKLYPEYLKEIEGFGDGIMAIFDKKPTPATTAYVTLVQFLVNEGYVTLEDKVIEAAQEHLKRMGVTYQYSEIRVETNTGEPEDNVFHVEFCNDGEMLVLGDIYVNPDGKVVDFGSLKLETR